MFDCTHNTTAYSRNSVTPAIQKYDLRKKSSINQLHCLRLEVLCDKVTMFLGKQPKHCHFRVSFHRTTFSQRRIRCCFLVSCQQHSCEHCSYCKWWRLDKKMRNINRGQLNGCYVIYLETASPWSIMILNSMLLWSVRRTISSKCLI